MELFINDKKNIPKNFVQFNRIKSLINSTYCDENIPMYIRIGKKRNCYRLSNLEIVQPINYDNVDKNSVTHLTDMGFSEEVSMCGLVVNNNNIDKTINWIVNLKETDELPKMKVIAYFYIKFKYTKGLLELIDKFKIYSDNIKIFLEFKNRSDYNFDLFINVYIDKLYLYNIYKNNDIPRLLILILDNDKFSICNGFKLDIKNIDINQTPLPNSEIKLKSAYKRTLFEYQKNNVNIMKQIEHRIRNNNGFYDTFQLKKTDTSGETSVEHIFNIKSVDENIFLSDKLQMMSESDLDLCKLYFRGGILSDDIGLGKTCSMIGLMMESYRDQTSLVLCPTRLCKQWQEEIEATGGLKSKIISSMSQFKKIKDHIAEYDIIIVSYNFLINKNYHKYISENPSSVAINKYIWERVIVDEGHEILSKQYPKRTAFELRKEIYKIESNFRWVCSGTPFSNNNEFWNIVFYLFQNPKNESLGLSNLFLKDFEWEERNFYNIPQVRGGWNSVININSSVLCKDFYHLLKNISKDLFIKNTKENLVDQVHIPNFTINTKFIDQTTIERVIYDSALGDTNKMIQLCNHILVSDHHIKILGTIPLPLDEIHNKMIAYYEKKINKLTIQHQTLTSIEPEQQTELIHTQIDELTNEISLNKSKFNIFNELNKKLEETESCPICYDELEHKTKSITPCGHFMCSTCITHIFKAGQSNMMNCPLCRFNFDKKELEFVKTDIVVDPNNKWGSKMSEMIRYLKEILSHSTNNRFIVFSQWDSMLKLVGKVLKESDINHLFLNGSIHVINGRIKKFKLDQSVRVVLLSSEKAASGLNLTEASHIILLDTLNNDKESSKIIEDQAIGRSVRLGQTKNVHVQRFIMRDTIEHDYYLRNIND